MAKWMVYHSDIIDRDNQDQPNSNQSNHGRWCALRFPSYGSSGGIKCHFWRW